MSTKTKRTKLSVENFQVGRWYKANGQNWAIWEYLGYTDAHKGKTIITKSGVMETEGNLVDSDTWIWEEITEEEMQEIKAQTL